MNYVYNSGRMINLDLVELNTELEKESDNTL